MSTIPDAQIKTCPFCGNLPEKINSTFFRCSIHTLKWMTLEEWSKRVPAAPEATSKSQPQSSSTGDGWPDRLLERTLRFFRGINRSIELEMLADDIQAYFFRADKPDDGWISVDEIRELVQSVVVSGKLASVDARIGDNDPFAHMIGLALRIAGKLPPPPSAAKGTLA